MKKISMKKMFLFSLAIPALWAGCARTVRTETTGVYQRDPNLNPPGTFPINKEQVALKIGVEQNAMVQDWKTNWMTRHFEKIGNYDLSFEIYPANEMAQKVELMVMAGGADLPDILMGSFDMAIITKYGQAGMIIPTNAYYQNSAHYINQAKKDLSLEPEKYVTSYDGSIYGMYGINESLNNQYSLARIMLFAPWLEKLGLKMPETTDEFLNVLRAFRDRDPNGNGQKDEIPLIAYRDNMQANYLYALMMPFIYTQPNFWMLNEGKIDVAFNKSGWRDGIRYTKQLIDEGLLSPLSFTQDNAQMTALMTPEPTKVGAMIRISGSNLGGSDVRRTQYEIVPPLQGPAGKNQLWWPVLPGIRMVITKNCKHPESAFMLGDYMATEDISVGMQYGEKGVDWTEAAPGSGDKGYVDGYRLVKNTQTWAWGTVQNKHWSQTGPYLRGKSWAMPDIATGSSTDFVAPIGRGLPTAIKYGTKNPTTGLVYNEQEQEVMNDFHATILTYVHESFARFAMGDLNIDRDWDSYIAEFNRMGLADVIRVTQSAYDRMNK